MKYLSRLTYMFADSFALKGIIDQEGSLTITADPLDGGDPYIWRFSARYLQNGALFQTLLDDIEHELHKHSQQKEQALADELAAPPVGQVSP
ncbi:hypothetical protein ACFQDN_25925 [Pseudomonas asuensis]|jgi:hypothetical protein|uniref:Uncharacterized protein n=1 Tax=Pseudomonas asuensis TaxID=1825787 RepID=A0ABQ2GY86_9PSED|nr:hypothetical protein [Pseudomonas asuensis]GGM16858.1 hypothetical protein GCM10009425_29840 [Pseudomonas asuensis]